MQIPFISTKLHIPTINGDIVSRPQLTDRLDSGLQSKLTLICAPAGFGKTTLAGSWLQAQKMHRGWVSLSEEDNDPARFIFYMVMALKNGHGDLGNSALKLLEKQKRPSPEAALTHLIKDVTAAGRDCILALDDFQVITDPAIHNSLTFLLDHLPSNLRIVIAGRSEPDLPISRFRARGQLTEITANDLRFSPDETRTYLNQVMTLNLDDDEITVIGERTEGWVTGLQLAALAASGNSDPSQLIDKVSGNDRFIADYLVDEVLEQQPQKIQHFLLHTAILDQFCAELCDDILNIKESRSIIAALEKANLFIFGLDTTRTWYRYHHLFAQILVSRFEQQYPEKISDLYLRACCWFKKEGRMAEALECSIKGRHYDQVDAIIEDLIEYIINVPTKILRLENGIEKIITWLNHRPKFLKNSMKAQLVEAFFMIDAGKLGQSEKLYKKVQASPLKPHPEIYAIFSTLGLAVIAYHRYLDGKATCRHCQKALQLFKESNNSICLPLLLGQGHLLLGDTANAEHYLNHCAAIANRIGQPYYLLPLAWGQLHKAKGRLHVALSQHQKGCDHDLKEMKASFYCRQIVGQAGIYYEYNQLETCRALLNNIQDTMGEIEFLDLLLAYHHTLIRLHCASNAFEKAQKALARAANIVTALDAPPSVMRRIQVLKANLALKVGDTDQAARCVRTIGEGIKDKAGYEVEPELMALARIRMAQNAFAPAMELLERMLEPAKRQKRVDSIIALETLAAMACFLKGDENRAMARLKQALIAARPEGYVRTFVDQGAPIRALLQMLSDHDDRQTRPENLSGYIQMLLQQFGPPDPSAPAGKQPSPKSRDLDALTRREQQVLELLALGLAYEEMADKLEISINTVRFHVKNIYSKLKVKNRFRAVKRAKQM